MRTWRLVAALLTLLACCACDLTEPSQPGPVPDDAAKDFQFPCPDDDKDGYSRISFCGPVDCNDVWNFSNPGVGPCPTYPYLEFVPPDGWQAADFSLFKAGSVYHVIYIKGPYWQQNPDTDGKSFGWATTQDGLTWTNLPDALTVNPDSDWDDAHIWAPCIVAAPYPHRYYMFYTGITFGPYGHEERIGVATSYNFEEWTRMSLNNCEGKESSGCLWEPDFPWNAWSEPGAWTKQCRDPYVYYDHVVGCWYMVYSTALASPSGLMVLGLAKSDDLFHWTDCGPIACTQGGVAESGAMTRVGSLVHLFWTSRPNGGISHATTTDPESGNWSAPALLPGSVENRELAAELLDQGDWFIYSYVADYPRSIRLKFMDLAGTAPPVQEPLASLKCVYIPASTIHPGAIELDNGIDDNCNGLVDEGTGPCNDLDGDLYGDPASVYCSRLGRDCDDNDPDIHPGAVGSCTNGIDDNCNGLIDEPSECLPKFPDITSHY